MWKKIIKSTKFLFSRSVPDSTPGRTLAQSFEILSRKVKGYSQPPRTAPSISKEQIMELKLSPVTKLNVQEIEILARELFRGSEHIKRDKSEAVLLWAKGCALGSVSCCYNYATSLRQGIGVAKDERKSFDILLELADEHRHAVAHYDVAVMASLGIGRKMDDAFIFKHFFEAAESGVVQAMFNVGSMYARGVGVDNNDSLALKYFEMAAYHGDANALYNIGAWYFAGRAVRKDDAKSLEYYLRAANQGHSGGAYNAAVQYMQGVGVPKNIEEAARLYEKAGSGGMPQAWYNLAKMHLDGLFGEVDLNSAKEYLLKGVALNDNNCAVELQLVEERIKARKVDI